MVYITFGNDDVTFGKIIVHRKKIINDGGKNVFYTMGVSHSEIGQILSTSDLVQAIEIKDDNNFFAHLICPRPELETFYDFYNTRPRPNFLARNIVIHMQRNGKVFEEKFSYDLSDRGIEDNIRDAGPNAVLLSSLNRFILYSLRLNEIISPKFLECTDFVGINGSKRASFAIPIPNSYDMHLPCTPNNIAAVRPANYLLGVIDENGNYVPPVVNLLTGEEYNVVPNNIACDGQITIDELINVTTKAEETKKSGLDDVKAKLLQKHLN